MKLLLIAGGGVSLKQAMALIGNLISNGAGSNELRDTAIAGGLGGLTGNVLKKIPGAGIVGAIGRSMGQEITGRAAQALLPSWAQRSYGNGGSRGGKSTGGEDEKGSDSKNSNSPTVSAGKNIAKNAIQGGNDDKKTTANNNKKSDDNNNNKKVEGNNTGNNLVTNAITNTGKESAGYDDIYD
jgi:hypothetical protein